MSVKVQIDGVGLVELDDSFQGLDPDAQQRTIEEIAASAKRSAPAASPSSPAPPAYSSPSSAPKAPRGDQVTYQAIERFVKSKYPQVKFTSDYRDPQHNKEVGGVEGSFHTTRQAVDMTGLDDKQREALKQDLIAAGASPREFLFHNAGSGMHLHVAADHVSDDFLKQWGPQAAPAPDGGTTPTDASPDRKAEIESALAQATGLLQAGKEKEAIDLLAQHRLNIRQGELEAFRQGKRSAGFKGPAEREAEAKVQPADDHSMLGLIANSAGRGIMDNIGFAADAAIGSLVPALAGHTFGKASRALDKAYSAVAGDPQPNGPLEKIAALGTRFGAGLILPGAEAGSAIPAIRDARFVGKQAKDPRAPFIAEVVQDLSRVAKEHAPNGVVPKGRGPVSVQQINDLEDSYLTGVIDRIGKLGVPEATKRRLKDAVENRHTIAHADLEALKGTTEGDAVALGIQKAQALRDLTPPYNGSKPGAMGNILEMLTNYGATAASGNPLGAVAGTLARKALRAYPGDVNASRLDAARKVLKRQSAYDKVAAKVGSSGQREAYQALNDKFEQAVSAREAERRAAQEAATNAKAEAAAERQHKAELRGQRFGMTDREYANYTARKSAAESALASNPAEVPTSRSAKALSALKRLEQASRSSAVRFDQRLEKATAPKKLSPQDALIKVNIDSGIYGRHNMYADTMGVRRADVEAVLPKVDTSDIPAFEMEKFTHGYPISKAVRTALLPRLRKALADEGISPATAANQAAKAHPEAEAASADTVYRPVEDQVRYDIGKSRSQSLQKYQRSQFEHQMPDVAEAMKPDLDHIVEVSRSGESGLDYFDRYTVPKLKQMGIDDDEIAAARQQVELIVSHKRHRLEADVTRK